LACDSGVGKGDSVFHSLCSVVNQDYNNVEIIVVENSHKKLDYISQIRKQFKKWIDSTRKEFTLKIINNKKSLGRGEARNIGLFNASSDLIIFLDDDTIILDSDAFSEIVKLSQKYDYGYGAHRLWTKDNLFQENSKTILKSLETGSTKSLESISSKPDFTERGDADSTLLSKTFITNLGFCKKDLMSKIGGFPNFTDYGYEDDCVMFRLFLLSKKMAILDGLRVIHVNHKIAKIKQRNLIYYLDELIKSGYYRFHVAKAFENDGQQNRILEPLKSLHFDDRVEGVIKKYSELLPINLNHAHKRSQEYWRNNNLPSNLQVAQLVYALQHSSNINDFIGKSSGDFDNLAELIRISCEDGIIKINARGEIKPQFKFVFTTPLSFREYPKPEFNPKRCLNQFPCDEPSRNKRYELIKERFPYCEYLKFGIIGDDDYISLKFVNDHWAWPVIIERDESIIDTIHKASDRFEILSMDVSSVDAADKLPTIQTFITDPPYTLHGALAFIFCGLKMMVRNDQLKEFYVILNPMMMGKNLLRLQQYLAEANIFIKEVVPNFSQYDLPKNYQEIKRAKSFLNKYDITTKDLKRSSSSNLYIFSTFNPNLTKLKTFIKYKKIYEHYDH